VAEAGIVTPPAEKRMHEPSDGFADATPRVTFPLAVPAFEPATAFVTGPEASSKRQ
jgi:hypothetical protein